MVTDETETTSPASLASSCSIAPFYDRDGITIYHGDNRDFIPHMPRWGVDCVITSPPYNLGSEPWPHLGNWKPGDAAGGRSKWRNGSDAGAGIQYAEHDDSIPWEEYVRWQRETIASIWNFLPDNGVLFYNHKPRCIGGRLWLPLELMPMNAVLRQIVVWSRPGGMNFNPTAFVPTHEWIMVIAKNEWRLKSRGVAGFGDVWQMNPDKNSHPAPFPVALPARVIDACAPGCVCDPFMGSGSTLVAAKRAGVRAIGFEKSLEYCQLAVERLRQNVFDFGGLDAATPVAV